MVSSDSLTKITVRPASLTEPHEPQYSVWRRDDNGNIFLVKDGLNEIDACRIARELEDTGHKQSYWVKAIL
jgi:glyoxylase-like metal-dependent hydrolase (beta-lactamase superfamily II)